MNSRVKDKTVTKTSAPVVQMLSIDENQAGQRIDNFLLARLKGVPKSRIYRIIRKGEVRVNKKRVKPEYKLQEADVVRVPPVRIAARNTFVPPSEQLQELIKCSLIYEDESLMVINKPSGIAVHAGTGVKIGLIEALRYMYREEPDLELVHRLDKGTSGCIMVAKTTKALRSLNNSLKQGLMRKVYHAIVLGNWPEQVSIVDQPLLKHQPRSGERFVEVSSQGKSARTHFRLLQGYSQYSLIEARPETGRTHQIRVHAQFVGHPLSGDDKYCSEKRSNQLLAQRGIHRLCLHAAELSLPHPENNQSLCLSAPYDKQFEKALNILNNSEI